MGFLSGITDSLFGGGEAKAAKKAGKARVNALNASRQYYQPFYNSGQSGLTNYENALNKYQDPVSYYNTLTSQYQPSAGFQNRLNRGLDVLNNNAAATGTLGMGGSQKEIAQYLTGLLNEDQQQFLNNIGNYDNTYLSGQGNLMNQGFNAGQGLAGIEQGIGEANAQRYQDEARARSNALNNFIGTGINMAANYATGGMYGLVQPFTSSFMNQGQNAMNNNVSWNRGY